MVRLQLLQWFYSKLIETATAMLLWFCVNCSHKCILPTTCKNTVGHVQMCSGFVVRILHLKSMAIYSTYSITTVYVEFSKPDTREAKPKRIACSSWCKNAVGFTLKMHIKSTCNTCGKRLYYYWGKNNLPVTTSSPVWEYPHENYSQLAK